MVIIFIIFEKEQCLKDLKMIAQKYKWSNWDSPWYNRSFPLEEIMLFLNKDKKRMSVDTIDLIVVNDENKVVVKTMKISYVRSLIEGKVDELKKFKF